MEKDVKEFRRSGKRPKNPKPKQKRKPGQKTLHLVKKQLPMELIVQIVTFLRFDNQASLRCVCKQWFERIPRIRLIVHPYIHENRAKGDNWVRLICSTPQRKAVIVAGDRILYKNVRVLAYQPVNSRIPDYMRPTDEYRTLDSPQSIYILA